VRVLLLHRQDFGGITSLTETLAVALRKLGDEVDIVNALSWIPNETSIAVAKKVTPKLKDLGKDYEIVHAFGYRAAWACSDAFSYKEAWIYTAYGMPKTTQRLLIDKLNEGQLGYCSSYAVRDELSGGGAMDLMVRYPGINPAVETSMEKLDSREQFELSNNAPIIGAVGRFVKERAFEVAIEAMEEVWRSIPDVQFVLAGEGPEEESLKAQIAASSKPTQIKTFGRLKNPAEFYRACDLILVPSRNAGFSLVAAESMRTGTAVMLRSQGGLPEMGERDHTIFLFEDDQDLARKIIEVLQMPMMLSSVANAGRFRSESLFSIDSYAQAIFRSYRTVLE
jgi:glycosyltransferase involved in cell wall biosynthesis